MNDYLIVIVILTAWLVIGAILYLVLQYYEAKWDSIADTRDPVILIGCLLLWPLFFPIALIHTWSERNRKHYIKKRLFRFNPAEQVRARGLINRPTKGT